jgi:hypothetical protein
MDGIQIAQMTTQEHQQQMTGHPYPLQTMAMMLTSQRHGQAFLSKSQNNK